MGQRRPLYWDQDLDRLVYLRESGGWGVVGDKRSFRVMIGSGDDASRGLVPRPPTTTGSTKYLREDGTWSAPGGGGGSSDHATLTNLPWTSSGHTGTASRVAGFSGAGAATYYQIGAAGGLQAWDADLDALAALGNGIALRTGGTWTAATASTVLDSVGSTRGAVLYRGAAGWAILAPGTSGDVLTSNGAGADPTYTTPSGGSGLTHGEVKRRLLALG